MTHEDINVLTALLDAGIQPDHILLAGGEIGPDDVGWVEVNRILGEQERQRAAQELREQREPWGDVGGNRPRRHTGPVRRLDHAPLHRAARATAG